MSPKSSTKKVGASKPKGTTRVKSGCYTCRIRRKKCDEQKNIRGECGTCVRLNVECLGFGNKRPEDLKDNRKVTMLRERIKCFLASKGMIKGHSTSGDRNANQTFLTLRTHDDYSSDASTSPPTSTLTLPDDTYSHVRMSSMRDEQCLNQTYDPPVQQLSPDSPYGSRAPFVNDVMFTADPHNSSSNSLVSPPCLTYDAHNEQSRASTSFISRSYNVPENHWGTYDADPEIPEIPEIPGQEMVLIPSYYSPPQDHDSLAGYYTKHVLSLQYLLADNDIRQMMSSTADSGDRVVSTAVSLLSAIYKSRKFREGNDTIKPQYGQLTRMFKETPSITVDHAIAALHTISSFLFDGGGGKWEPWLRIACTFADGYLQRPAYSIHDHIANFCDDSIGCFILRTAMWFDVIASVTLFRPPHFLLQYRNLFDPDRAFGDPWLSYDPRMSMMSVMGCDNRVVWAMGEISYLACWKAEQERKGCLSMPDLVEQGIAIERKLLNPLGPEALHARDELRLQQRLSADIFRASTRLYLHSVISGDFPYVPEIIKSVKEIIDHLGRARQHFRGTSRSVVRSVVFSIFICGCLTDDVSLRRFLIDTLMEQANEPVGNCTEVKRLMEKVWANRGEMPDPSRPVPWREELKRSGLLLV